MTVPGWKREEKFVQDLWVENYADGLAFLTAVWYNNRCMCLPGEARNTEPKQSSAMLRTNASIYGKESIAMNNFDAFKSEQLKETVPAFNVGDTVRVHNLIKEGTRERIQMYEGTVIGKHGGGISETFTVRRVAYGVGVEKTFPLHSPHVVKVDVLRRGKVRRAKLYYLRDRVGKSSKVKELI